MEDLWAQIAYELSFIPWKTLDMDSLTQVDWKHDIDWKALWQKNQETQAEVYENLQEIA